MSYINRISSKLKSNWNVIVNAFLAQAEVAYSWRGEVTCKFSLNGIDQKGRDRIEKFSIVRSMYYEFFNFRKHFKNIWTLQLILENVSMRNIHYLSKVGSMRNKIAEFWLPCIIIFVTSLHDAFKLESLCFNLNSHLSFVHFKKNDSFQYFEKNYFSANGKWYLTCTYVYLLF